MAVMEVWLGLCRGHGCDDGSVHLVHGDYYCMAVRLPSSLSLDPKHVDLSCPYKDVRGGQADEQDKVPQRRQCGR